MMKTTPPLSNMELTQHLTATPLTVLVGRERKTFHLSPTLLAGKSEFFRGCLSGGFAESQKNEVELPEESVAAFEWFLRWVYTGDLAPFEDYTDPKMIVVMVEVYALADKLIAPDLVNRAVDMVQELTKTCPLSVQTFGQATALLQRESMMMKYLMTEMAEHEYAHEVQLFHDDKDWVEFLGTYPAIGAQLMRKTLDRFGDGEMRGYRRREDPAWIEGCHWHQHLNGEDLKCERWPQQGSKMSVDDSEDDL